MTTIPINDEIRIAPFRSEDLARLVELLNDREISRQLLRIAHPYTVEDGREWLERMEKLAGVGVGHWAIRLNEGDRLIGGVGLEGYLPRNSHRVEVGYWLGRDFWGRGYMTATLARVTRFVFEELKQDKITAHVFLSNPASCRVLEKCGFQKEGLMPAHYKKQGELIDAWAYGKLASQS